MTSTTATSTPETPIAAAPELAAAEVELLIGGMTCASCAARVEKKLNRMDGVTATVNYATEKAKVTYPEGITTEDLVATVAPTGYSATLPWPAVSSSRAVSHVEEPDWLQSLPLSRRSS